MVLLPPVVAALGGNAFELYPLSVEIHETPGELPAVVKAEPGHIAQRQLVFLRRVYAQGHVVHWACRGHEQLQEPSKKRRAHEGSGKERLYGADVPKLRVFAEQVVNECGAASPVPDDEDGIVFQPGGLEFLSQSPALPHSKGNADGTDQGDKQGSGDLLPGGGPIGEQVGQPIAQ